MTDHVTPNEPLGSSTHEVSTEEARRAANDVLNGAAITGAVTLRFARFILILAAQLEEAGMTIRDLQASEKRYHDEAKQMQAGAELRENRRAERLQADTE